jgi:hypothetical protein
LFKALKHIVSIHVRDIWYRNRKSILFFDTNNKMPSGSIRKTRNIHIPTKQNAARPVTAQKSPLTLSGLKENGSRMIPSATSFRAPSECHGCRRMG